MRRTRSTVLGASMGFSESANTNGLAEVNVSGNGSSADVEPESSAVFLHSENSYQSGF
jgi:hypothetical protein